VCTHGFFLFDANENRPNGQGRSRALERLLFNRDLIIANPAIRSGLVFAGANWAAIGQGSSFLTALEASELDLRRVDLAVLSACETGRGQVARGEGVLGLQRAFQIAGARNVVASLWRVDDQATAALMRLFYHKLWIEKKTPATALREAQLWILNNPDQISTIAATRGPNFGKVVQLAESSKRAEGHKRSSPYLWAGFVIAGSGN
jgi:CHAT domain-containing protein